jgi:hypothetical protein
MKTLIHPNIFTGTAYYDDLVKSCFGFVAILIGTLFFHTNSYAQSLGLNNATPDASSILDATATNRGILLPRMTTANRTAIAAPADGLLVYDTDLDAFYYYDATAVGAWRALLASSKSTASLGGWSTLGNAGTVAATNFLGTTDAVDFRIRTTNLERMTIQADGDVGIGTTAPTGLLELWSNADANLIITADADNVTETDNPYLKLVQDGGTNSGLIGLNSAGVDPAGTVVATALTNALFLGTDDNPIQFAIDNVARMTILDASGNVGIGTNAPESLFQLYGGAANTWLTIGASQTVDYNAGIYLKENETTAGNSRGFKFYYNSNDFYIDRNDGAADANAFFIERTNGDVGIGTTAPSHKLEVIGDAGFFSNAADIEGMRIQTEYVSSNSSGRLYFDEAAGGFPNQYGFSLLYAGNANPTLGGVGFTLPTNVFYIMRHQASTTGAVALAIDRATGNVGIGAGASAPTSQLDVDGTVKLGTSGTIFTYISNTTVAKDLPSIAAGGSSVQTFAVTTASTTNSTVTIAPQNALTAGLIIQYARVSAANTVEVTFWNASAGAIDMVNMNFYITVLKY